jgi:glycosyltransferase involved in cell wall biosynthesis
MRRISTMLIDLRAAQTNPERGIATYSQSLVEHLCRGLPGTRCLFLHDPARPLPVRHAELSRLGTWHDEQALAAGAGGEIDALFTACFFVWLEGRGAEYLLPSWLRPHAPLRLGLVYDLIPYLFPDAYLADAAARRNYMTAFDTMRSYDALFAISETTRRDTIRLAGIPGRRISTIDGDIDEGKRAHMEVPADPLVPRRHGLEGPYFLYIGGGDWRKNTAGMVRGFAAFYRRDPRCRLAITCRLGKSKRSALEALAAEEGLPPGAVVCTGYVSDGDLIQLVRHAEASVFPSFYEGLGLPILESYAAGTPVLGADNSAIQELVLPELLFSAACPQSLAAALGRLRADPGLAVRSLDFGTRVLGRIGWPTAARRIAECLRSAAPVAAATAVRILDPPSRVAVVAAPGSDADALDDLAGPWAAGCGTDLFLPAAATPATSDRRARIYPIDIVRTVVTAERYRRAIFVLGAEADPVEQLLALRLGRGVERWVYVPGPNPTRLLATSLRGWRSDPAAALGWLMEKGEITGFLVDDGVCRERIVATLGGLAAGVRVEVRRPVAAVAA